MLKLMKNTFIGIIKKMILQTFKHDTKSAKKNLNITSLLFIMIIKFKHKKKFQNFFIIISIRYILSKLYNCM